MKTFLFIIIGLVFLKVEAQSSTFSVADDFYELGNYTAAINEYAKSTSPKAQHQIARAYNAMGNYNKAIAQYEAVIAKDSSNLLAQFELGKLLDKTKKFEKAEILFQTLTEKSAENPEFFYYLGKVRQENLDFDKGKEALKKAVELDTTHLRSIFLLGKYYVRADEPLNAHEVVDLGLKTAPEDVALINLKALAYYNLGQYEKAIPLFEKLLQLGEKKPFVYKKLGFSYFSRWKYDEAKEIYHTLAKIENEEPDAFFGLGEVFLKEKQLDSAEIYFHKSIAERRYVFNKEYANLGRVARLQNDTKKALEYYTKAWEEDPVNQYAYWQVCILADEYYKAPKIKLDHYQKLLTDFDNLMPFLKERAQKRVGELKEEIHFAKK